MSLIPKEEKFGKKSERSKTCKHDVLCVMYNYSNPSEIKLMFQCANPDCNAFINKLDNTKTFKIIPNKNLADGGPKETGLWKTIPPISDNTLTSCKTFSEALYKGVCPVCGGALIINHSKSGIRRKVMCYECFKCGEIEQYLDRK